MPIEPPDSKSRDMPDLVSMAEDDLLFLYATLHAEMRRRGIATSVGLIGEKLAIGRYCETAGLPNLQAAPPGTKNVDALSRAGERFSIKTLCNAKKTGTVYPDSENEARQLFEKMLLVRLAEDWSLHSIYEFTWEQFVTLRSWDSRMNAWYLSASGKTLKQGREVYRVQEITDA